MGTILSIKRKKFEKLESMECWPLIKELFLGGAKVTELVKLIRENLHEMTDIKPESLRVCLQDWKRENLALFNKAEIPQTFQKLAEQVQGIPVKPGETFQIILAVQVDRLMDSYKKEKELGYSLAETNEIVKVIALIAREQSLHEARMINAKRGKYLSNKSEAALMDLQSEKMRQEYGETYAKVVSNPDSRRRVLSIVERVMSKEKKIVTQNPRATFDSKPTIPKVM